MQVMPKDTSPGPVSSGSRELSFPKDEIEKCLEKSSIKKGLTLILWGFANSVT